MKRKKSIYPEHGRAHWTEQQKLEAVATYVMLGNMVETALVTSVPLDTLKVWKKTDWFRELQLQIRDEDVQQLDTNIQKVVGKALKALEDRLDNGDYQYDPKTGKPVRIPIKATVALKVTTELLTKQDKLRAAPEKLEVEKTVDARLLKLAEEFARFAKARDVTPVPSNIVEMSVITDIIPLND